ncbi:MAG: GTPase, partial [Paludibacteraceae bacterium]
KSFVMADIPGLIEGAAEGKGLGLRFLRHIERNSILLFMVPADSKNIKDEYYILLNELKKYNPELVDKQRILAISKSDMLDDELIGQIKKELPENIQTVFISSVSGLGIDELKDILWEELNKDTNKVVELVHRSMELSTIDEDEEDIEIESDDASYENDEEDLSKFKGIGWDD